MKGSAAEAVGVAELVELVRTFLSGSGGGAREDASDCPICFCRPEGSIQLLEGCGHSYCGDCFEGWLGQAHFPFVCLAAGCQRPIALRDLKSRLGESFIPLLRLALDEHVNSHGDDLRFCVTPDCPNVYATVGERVVCCSTCAVSVCTRCHVEDHAGLTCEEYEMSKAPADGVRNSIIEECLTDRCPRCRKAFFDFDGCFAVKCANCPCGFCGWCLSDCGNDAHEHVRNCRAKPSGCDSYFGSRAQFEGARRNRQRQLVVAYLNKLDAGTRAAALKSIDLDLRDLGLAID